jgi:hypothetical protein
LITLDSQLLSAGAENSGAGGAQLAIPTFGHALSITPAAVLDRTHGRRDGCHAPAKV